MDRYDVVIAGAGAAGLAHAFFRRRARPDLRLLVAEGNDRPGGWVRTELRSGFTCEAGPQGFRPNADTDALFAALGCQDRIVDASPAAKKRWVLLDGRMVALPGGPLQFLTSPLMSFGDKLRIFGEPWRARGTDPEESMSGFLTRRFGPGTRRLAEALAHGIFAGDAERLEMRSMFPAAVELETAHGSIVRGMFKKKRDKSKPRVRRPVLCSCRGGMSGIVDRLVEALGPAVALATPVQALARDGDGYRVELGGRQPRTVFGREVVLAVPAAAAAPLLAPLDRELDVELQQIRGAGVASVYLGAPKAQFTHPLDGFGCLAPKQPTPLLGVLLCSSVFPGHAPEGHALLRVMTGGVDHPHEIERNNTDLCAQATAVARQLFGLQGEPTFLHVERCKAAIAQYEAGHSRRLERIAARVAAHPGLALLGASYRQIAVVGQWTEKGSRP